MIILGKTPKDWQKEIGSKSSRILLTLQEVSLYYRTEIVIFLIGFILGAIIF
jgi:hypothetical protein